MNKIEQAVLDTGGDWGSIKKITTSDDSHLVKSTEKNTAYPINTYVAVDASTYFNTCGEGNGYWEQVGIEEEYKEVCNKMNSNYGNLITLTKQADMNIAFYTDNKVSIYADDEDVTFEHTDKNVEIITDYLKAKIALEDME